MSSGKRYVIIGTTSPGFTTPLCVLQPPSCWIQSGTPTGSDPGGAFTIEGSMMSDSQPLAMKRAVMRPHAMKAAMLGRTMPLTNVPNFCTNTRPRDDPAGAWDSTDDVVI